MSLDRSSAGRRFRCHGRLSPAGGVSRAHRQSSDGADGGTGGARRATRARSGPRPGAIHLTDADYEAVVAELLAQHTPDLLWVFAYGFMANGDASLKALLLPQLGLGPPMGIERELCTRNAPLTERRARRVVFMSLSLKEGQAAGELAECLYKFFARETSPSCGSITFVSGYRQPAGDSCGIDPPAASSRRSQACYQGHWSTIGLNSAL